MSKPGTLIPAAQHFPQAAVSALGRLSRHAVEGLGVYQVAAGKLEQPASEVELTEGAALPVPCTLLGELGCKTGGACDPALNPGLAGEQHVLSQLVGSIVDPAYGRFVQLARRPVQFFIDGEL